MKNETGIGILDLYDQESLNSCIDSLSDFDKNNIFIASLTNNKISNYENIKYTSTTPLATLRNYIISQFRIKNYKYIFLIHSNLTLKNKNLVEDTLKLASTFGTWFITGHESKVLALEDDSGLDLNISNKLNSNFLFFASGIIKNNGYFDERFFNDKELDVIDYIIKIRNKKLFPPHNYFPTIPNDWFEKSSNKIEAIGYKQFPDHKDKSIELSYGFFVHNHKYIPNQNDPPPAESDLLLKEMEELQKNYAK